MTLTSQQLNNAQAILADNSLSKLERTEQFYSYLNSLGDSYSRLALEITTNDNTSWQGQIATNFANANSANIDISYGSNNWIELNFDLAQRHIQTYVENSGVAPQWDQIQEYHNEEYAIVGLAPDDWFPNRFLNDSADPAARWDDWQYNTSELDIIQDAFVIANDMAGAVIPMLNLRNYINPQAHQQALLDIENSKAFTKQFFTAFSQLEGQAIVQLVDDGFIFDEVGQFVSDVWDTNGQLNSWFDGYIDDLQSALNNPGATVKELPSWVSDLFDAGWELAKQIASPLVLDLDGDGIELAALGGVGSVYWDIDLDGFGEASGWISGGDGLLAIDLNSDGLINDHGELFGDQTGSANGFLALAAYDSNTDGSITSADTQWADLLVWIDADGNGFSAAEELHTLDFLGITSINLSYANVSYMIAGNEIKQESSFTINGQTHDIVDAWFTYDDVNTSYTQDYTLDVRTLFLPTVRGYGEVADLHIAMSMDETLLNMVQDIATADAATLFDASFDLRGKIDAMLYRWADVEALGPNGRGSNMIDARHLEFLEEFFGQDFVQFSDPNPAWRAAVVSQSLTLSTLI